VGGLSHTIEEEGVATTQISLIREHTEIIKPPRALWVPFELGRPLGAPNDPAFQTRVLVSVLMLLEAAEGPVLQDFPEDAPGDETYAGPVACPIPFVSLDENIGKTEQLLSAFRQEVASMRNWYELAVAKRGRSTGVTGLEPDQIAEFLSAFIQGDREANPLPDVSLASSIRMAVEDLKAVYFEAVTAQPGQPTGSAALADWFWGRTTAAQVVNRVREICLETTGDDFQLLGKLLLVPRTQLHHFAR
jgi:hypothetical protein